MSLSRRSVLVGLALAVGGCVTQRQPTMQTAANAYVPDPYYVAMYGPVTTEPWPIAGVDLSKVDPRLLRQEVDYATYERPGTIVVDPGRRFLYLVREGGKAMRYGVGVGRPGFEWAGAHKVTRKAEWPGWTPPPQMRQRQPDLPAHMEGGPNNPLGAGALYHYRGGRDTKYRLHGTNRPVSIGQAMSSGCIRMLNTDVEHLYARTNVGTPVVVLA